MASMSSFVSRAEKYEMASKRWNKLFTHCGDEEDITVLKTVQEGVEEALFVNYKELLMVARDLQDIEGKYFSSPKVEKYALNSLKYHLQAEAAKKAARNEGD